MPSAAHGTERLACPVIFGFDNSNKRPAPHSRPGG
jgi:hypothetical protein